MIIRLVLFALFFSWVVRAPFAYRDSVAQAAAKDNPELRLASSAAHQERTFLAGIKLPIGDKRRLEAISGLALVRWRQMNFIDAENLYKLAITENKNNKTYNQTLVNDTLSLAGVYRDQMKFADARTCYLSVLNHDRKFLTGQDPRIARDLSNLGVNQYAEAGSKDRGEERTKLLRQANSYLEQALQIYAKFPQDGQHRSIALSNQCLVLRDLNEFQRAQSVKDKVDAVELAAKRSCKLP